jgi:hypothetical protein
MSSEQAVRDFISLYDSIYYDGYCRQMAADNPQQFNYELKEFLNVYYEKPSHHHQTNHLGEAGAAQSNERSS